MSSVYGTADFDAMFADEVRTPAYLEAIARTVRPGDVAVEIGTGVGYFAVAACRAGARRVFAIEREAAVVLAEDVARENGFSDRIVCIRGDANRIVLPERGTVLICDLRGAIPLLGDAIPTIIAARERLLTPDARIVSRRDVIRAAPCTAPRRWESVEMALGNEAHGIRRGTMAAHTRAQVHGDSIRGDSLCAEPVEVAVLEYATIDSPHVDAHLRWTVSRAAPMAGVGLWFDAELAEGVGFSTAPGGADTVYGHAFLPFERALDAMAGDALSCRVRARLVDRTYVFAWDTELQPADATRAAVSMRQSSLGGLLASDTDRAIRRDTYRPDPATFALIRDLVSLADGRRSVAEIAEVIRTGYPGRFDSAESALSWVTRSSAQLAELDAV